MLISRRGPVKEEKKMIQRRLEETEDLLVGLLRVVPDELLADGMELRPSAQRQREAASSSKDNDLLTAQIASLGPRKSVWDNAPLNTVAEVRRWQVDYDTRSVMSSSPRKVQQDSPVPDEMDLGTPFEQGSWEVGNPQMLPSMPDTFDYQLQNRDAIPPTHDDTTATIADSHNNTMTETSDPSNTSIRGPKETIPNSEDVLTRKEVLPDLPSHKSSPLNSSVRPSTINPWTNSDLLRQQEEDLFW
ncbi:hypothetical protein V501_03356 [Pseudogymnoascus sp. VKM F-4519 (FW-2642)]|nr:hypothetical protein V501_03356 [Pseudogymnoascus sp. VKM F-4519 (FW-2642)]